MVSRLLPGLALICSLVLATACAVTVGTTPDAYPFPSEVVFDVKRGLALDVVNFYAAPERVPLARNVYCDLRHFTDTSVAIVRRELGTKGLRITADANKKLVLRIVDPVWDLGTWTAKSRVTLQAHFGDSSISVIGQSQTAGNAMRAFNAAILRSVIALLTSPELKAYLDGSP